MKTRSIILNCVFLTICSMMSCNNNLKKEEDIIIDKLRKIQVKNLDNLYKYPNGIEVPNDTTVYKNVLRWKKSEECAKLLSYAKTNVELLRLNKDYTNYRLHQYNSCEANMYNDSIEITINFSSFGGGDKIYYESKPIKILVNNSNFSVDITHTSDVVSMIKKDGKYVRQPFPKSQIEYAKLSLNKEKYEIGDTIIGNLKVKSIFLKESLRKDKKTDQWYTVKERSNEIAKGNFRAILEDKSKRCLDR